MRALSQTPSVACSHQWERYRSGHNGTDSKSVGGITPHVGSNPTLSAKQRAPRQRGFLFGGVGGVDEPTGSTNRQDSRFGRRSEAEAPRSGEGQDGPSLSLTLSTITSPAALFHMYQPDDAPGLR